MILVSRGSSGRMDSRPRRRSVNTHMNTWRKRGAKIRLRLEKNITIKKRSHTYENDLDDIMRIKTNVYGKTSRVYLYAYPTSRTAAR